MAKDEGQELDQSTEVDDSGETDLSHENGQEDRLKALEANQALSSVLADPDVLAVVNAKRQGKQIRVTEVLNETDEETQESEKDEAPGSDLADDDPLKATLERIGAFVDKKLTKALQPLQSVNQRLSGVETLANTIQQKEVVDQVKAVRGKYKDFDEYKTQIMGLAKAQPGLNIEELYIIAKSRSGKLKLNEPSTFSERPSNQPRRPSKDGKKTPVRPPGKRGFDEILGEALNNLSLDGAE